jgi:hypothetical protein
VRDDGWVLAATSAGINPPLYYALVGVPVRMFGDTGEVFWYRAAAALLNGAVLLLAAWRLRPFGRASVVALVVFTPAAWFLIGVVNPNGFEFVLALLAWVGVARWDRDRWPARAWWIALPLAVAVACRPSAAMVAVALLVVLEVRCRPSRWERVVLWGSVAAATTSVFIWNRIVHLHVDDPRTAGSGSSLRAAWPAIRSVPTTAREMIASLGWYEFAAPIGIVLLWVLAACIATSGWRPSSIDRRAAAAWLAVLVLGPVVFEIVVHRSLGPIWQGRYSLPMFAGVVAVLLQARLVLGRRAASAIVGLGALVEVSTYWWVVRRYSVGVDGSWWMTGGYRSTAVVGPRALVIINTVLALGLTAFGVRSVGLLDVTEDVDDHVGGT